MLKTSLISNLLVYFIFSIFIVLGLAQIDLLLQIKYSEGSAVFIHFGIPFNYFYFSRSAEMGIHGFNIYNFIWDLSIVYAPFLTFLIIKFYFKKEG